MSETNFDWDDMRLFLAVARDGGLAAAATATGKSPPTLGRRMLALERRLGRDLFHRKPRGYTLTPEGQALLDQAVAFEAQIQPMFEPNPELTAPIVKLSAGIWVTQVLCQNVSEITGTDTLRLRFTAADEIADIGRREALIGVRNRRPEGLGLAGRKVGRVQFAAYAREPSVTTWARVIANTPSANWVSAETEGQRTIEVTSPLNALDLARAGGARVVLPTFIGTQLAELQQVSPPIKELAHDQWLVTHHEDRFLPDVRTVIDRVYAILKRTCAAQ